MPTVAEVVIGAHDLADDADDRVELQQLHRHRGIVEVHLIGLQRVDDRGRQGIHVYLQPGELRGCVSSKRYSDGRQP